MSAINTISAGTLDITCYAGDNLQAVLTFTDNTSAPIDLTGYVMKMQIKDSGYKLFMTLSEGDGLTKVTNVITIDKIITPNTGGSYLYDLQGTFTDGTITTFLKGAFNITRDVTQ